MTMEERASPAPNVVGLILCPLGGGYINTKPLRNAGRIRELSLSEMREARGGQELSHCVCGLWLL